MVEEIDKNWEKSDEKAINVDKEPRKFAVSSWGDAHVSFLQKSRSTC